MTRTQKTTGLITLTAAGILLSVAVVMMIINPAPVDDIMMLEEQYPAFANYLSKGKIYSCNDEDTDNLLRLSPVNSGSDDITCTVNPDSSITVTGRLDDADQQSFSISAGDYIPDGTYIYSDGSASTDKAYLYIAGWIRTISGTDRNGRNVLEIVDRTRLTTLPNNNIFEVSSLYNCYWVGGMIAGEEDINITFYPCINKSGLFSPAWMQNDLGEYKRYIVSVPNGTQITQKDMELLRNMLKIQYPAVSSVEIDYTDAYESVLNRSLYGIDELDV